MRKISRKDVPPSSLIVLDGDGARGGGGGGDPKRGVLEVLTVMIERADISWTEVKAAADRGMQVELAHVWHSLCASVYSGWVLFSSQPVPTGLQWPEETTDLKFYIADLGNHT